MGSGIAQVFATAGFTVLLSDVNESQLDRAQASISRSLEKFVEKGKLNRVQRDEALSRITMTTGFENMKDADLLIEAAVEDEHLKRKIFSTLSRLIKKDSILASNTSSIPIDILAKETTRPDKVIGMHFMNPPPLMKGIEVICTEKTSAETERTIITLIEKLGKTAVKSQDRPAFIANRVLMPMLREAMLALEEKVATRDDIDLCMKDCCNFPMGPLALADLIGLDTCHSIMNVMATGLRDARYAPPKILNDLVAQGHLGKKTGRGFYDYA